MNSQNSEVIVPTADELHSLMTKSIFEEAMNNTNNTIKMLSDSIATLGAAMTSSTTELKLQVTTNVQRLEDRLTILEEKERARKADDVTLQVVSAGGTEECGSDGDGDGPSSDDETTENVEVAGELKKKRKRTISRSRALVAKKKKKQQAKKEKATAKMSVVSRITDEVNKKDVKHSQAVIASQMVMQGILSDRIDHMQVERTKCADERRTKHAYEMFMSL